ncbi:MAG: hypothetical protein AAGI11_15675 [Pseudomonadota bacterium]
MRNSFACLLLASSLILSACSDGGDSRAPVDSGGAVESAFQAVQRDYMEQTLANGSGGTYGGMIHLAMGEEPPAGAFDRDIEQLNTRDDTADFGLPGLLTVLATLEDSPGMDPAVYQAIKEEVIRFKFWPDELEDVPGTTDLQEMVTWTENHYILFTSGAYLAGQLYPDTLFPASGRTGLEQMEVYRPRIMKWLELRYQSGFSEWLSNVYYNEDMPALLALINLADDAEIVAKATIVLDLMFADLALNSFQGFFSSTHGRTYSQKEDAGRDSTRGAVHMAFDLHTQNTGNMTASMLAMSDNYRVPAVLRKIARDVEENAMENRQRMGIKLEEAAQWGLSLDRLEDGMTFLTTEPYPHPLFIDMFYEMLNTYEWWDHRDFAAFKEYRSILDDPDLRAFAAEEYEWDITRNYRPEVNIYTYRTPSYMLSTAQDWRKGFGGDQTSIWQATLGQQAVAFTTHPATEDPESATPNYWVGYGTLPRAAQVKNVVMTLYDVDTRDGLYYSNQPLYTHAFLPRARFDETVKEGQWFFARLGDAYLALWSSDPAADWVRNTDAERHGGEDYEIIANGEKTIWLLELGDADAFGDFASFRAAIGNASLQADADALTLRFDSPSLGTLEMGWEGDVLHNGTPVELDDYERYGNPWSQSAFPGDDISFRYGDDYLELNLDTQTRDASGYLE